MGVGAGVGVGGVPWGGHAWTGCECWYTDIGRESKLVYVLSLRSIPDYILRLRVASILLASGKCDKIPPFP